MSASLASNLSPTMQAQRLLKLRWAVLGIGVTAIVGLELIEHHDPSQFSFWFEITVYGLAVPLLSWFMITVLAYSYLNRAKAEDKSERHRQFTLELTRQQDWGELTNFITRYVGANLPSQRVTLYTYEYQESRLKFASEWRADNLIVVEKTVPPELCPTCPIRGMQQPAALSQCQQNPLLYCLLLAYNNVRIGALILYRQPTATFTKDQTEFMSAVSSEIALAMALLIAYPRQVAQARASAQLDERRRITYELHDSLAQQVGFLHLALDRLSTDQIVAQNPQLQAELENACTVAGDAYERIRNTLSLLRAQEIPDLSKAIADYTDSYTRRTKLQIDIDAEGEPVAVSPEFCQYVFGLLREGLNNVEKHARASRVQIMLNWSADTLNLELKDDGIGFDPAKANMSGHYGLTMIAERIAQLRGDFRIEGSPGRGTCLQFTIPLPNHSAATALAR